MSQINVEPGGRGDRDNEGRGAMTAATRNLTWAIAAVIVIAAIAIALVYVGNNVHP